MYQAVEKGIIKVEFSLEETKDSLRNRLENIFSLDQIPYDSIN